MQRAVKSGSPADRLLPQGRLAGPMPWVVAIMVFLTMLSAAAGIALSQSAAAMGEAAGNGLTVQVVAADAEVRARTVAHIEQALRRTAGVGTVRVVPRAALLAQLEPWLGGDLEGADIPIPALIDVELAANGPDAVTARRRVTDIVASVGEAARVEAHADYLRPVAALVRTIGWIALGIVALMGVATAFVVVLAARGAHASHRATIEILHMLGATDAQVMRLFQRRLTRDVSFGAAVGLLASAATIMIVSRSLAFVDSALLGSVALPVWAWMVLPALALVFVAVAWLSARMTLRGALVRAL